MSFSLSALPASLGGQDVRSLGTRWTATVRLSDAIQVEVFVLDTQGTGAEVFGFPTPFVLEFSRKLLHRLGLLRSVSQVDHTAGCGKKVHMCFHY